MKKFSFESNNPFLSEKKLNSVSSQAYGMDYETTTVSGAINKSFILFAILMATSFVSYLMPSNLFLYLGMIGGFIAVLVSSFKPALSPYAAPIYAGLEGLFLGTISAIFAVEYDGIIFQAMTLTLGCLVTMLIIYKSGLVTVNEKFRAGVMMATGAIFLVYMVSFIGSFFGWNMPYLHEGGAIGIGISLVIIGVACLNLLLDFDLFEKAEERNAPKYMEWFCAMSLMITLVWLYIEMLRLLSKLRD